VQELLDLASLDELQLELEIPLCRNPLNWHLCIGKLCQLRYLRLMAPDATNVCIEVFRSGLDYDMTGVHRVGLGLDTAP